MTLKEKLQFIEKYPQSKGNGLVYYNVKLIRKASQAYETYHIFYKI